GFKTLLLERNARIGGACSSYVKEGFTIDVACHFFSHGLKGRFGKALRQMGLMSKNERGEWTSEYLQFRAPLYPAIKFKGKDGFTQMGMNQFMGGDQKKAKSKASKETKGELGGFEKNDQQDFMKVLGNMLSMSKRDIKKLAERNIDVRSWVNEITTNRKVHDFVAVMVGTFFTIPPRLASASEYIICLQETVFKNDTGYPIGGSIAIPMAFIRAMKKFGGELRTETEAEKIVVENDAVKGVQVNGELVSAPIVISNAGIKRTVSALVGEKYFEKEYAARIKNLMPSYSSIAFKFALKKPIDEIGDKPVLQLTQTEIGYLKGFKAEEGEKRPKTPGYLVPVLSNMDPSLAPKGKQLLIVGTSAPPSVKGGDWKRWTDAYMLDICEFYPQLDKKDYVEFMDITTPKEITQYIGKAGGPVEGTALTPEQSGKNRPSSILPIKGLFVVGDTAGIDTHGVGTGLAADSALKLCKHLISTVKK
ncbi:MAG: phytoene desaturase family protein, partial [Candidatus Helarchaeota archaeon]